LQQLIEPALARGEVVLCDRFTDATFAYQGGGRGFDATMLNYLEQAVQAVQSVPNPGATARVRQPDLTVWFDLPPEIAAARLAGARAPDKFESESLEFFRRVSQGYLQRLQADTARFARIHADQEREAVWQDVHLAVQARGWLL
jgi:dTMP kinase